MDRYARPSAWFAPGFDSATSQEAVTLRSNFVEIRAADMSSISQGDRGRALVDALLEVSEDASVEGWDGYEARPVASSALMNAFRVVLSLPTAFPLPEIVADPDGEISLEWHLGPRNTFSFSVGPAGELAYAGLFGHNKVHGTEYFTDEIPEAVLDNLRRVFLDASH